MKTSTGALKKFAGALAASSLLMSSFGMALPFAQADTAQDLLNANPTLAEQIICYVDQQLGPNIPFDPQINYCNSNPPPVMQCADTLDNDSDGLIDLADPDCDSASDNTESGSMGTTTMQCADTLDNDSDGVIDLADPDCDNAQDNSESGSMGTTTMQCADTLDNDTDGVIDLADPDCVNAQDNTESGTMGTSTGTTTDAALHVDSIDAVKIDATADNSYANGWRYIFHITDPNGEPSLAMKFSDWVSGSSSVPVANNMQVSSAQASNTSPVTLTAANSYSSPAFNMVTDLNPSMPGRQVDVVVEIKIPVGTPNGSYTTTYGVRSLP